MHLATSSLACVSCSPSSAVGIWLVRLLSVMLDAYARILGHGSTLTLCLWLIGKFSISWAFTSIRSYASELFPTVYRSSCIGICEMVARFGGVFAPLTRTLVSLLQAQLNCRMREVSPLRYAEPRRGKHKDIDPVTNATVMISRQLFG